MANRHIYNTDALRALEPNASWVMEDFDLDKLTWQSSSITQPSNSVILAKAAELQTAAETEYTNQAYARSRKSVYPALAEQFDLLYHDIQAGKLGIAATTGNWYVGITSVKTAYPKP